MVSKRIDKQTPRAVARIPSCEELRNCSSSFASVQDAVHSLVAPGAYRLGLTLEVAAEDLAEVDAILNDLRSCACCAISAVERIG